jgi:ABC-type glycerol-3-phosphate transport system substrate-binding protein
MKFLSDLVVVDKTSPTPAQMQGISKPFTTGKVGMTTEGTWRIDSYRSGLEDDFGIVMVPKGPQSGGKDVVFGWADAYSVSAFTKHAQESWDWIMFMAGPGRPIDSIVGGKIPAWKESAYSEEWLEKDQLPANKALVLRSADLIGESVTLPPRFDEWNSAVQSDFDKISLGEGEFYAVMKELDAKVESILARK